jgi:hypothetical protein
MRFLLCRTTKIRAQGLGAAASGRKKATRLGGLLLSFSLFLGYQIRGEKTPIFFSDFGVEVVCFVGL